MAFTDGLMAVAITLLWTSTIVLRYPLRWLRSTAS
jgi:uncharacterized membrane protein